MGNATRGLTFSRIP